MTDLSKFNIKATDWRGQIRKNKSRSRWVIFTFIFLYAMVGLLVDLFVTAQGTQVYVSHGNYGEYIRQINYSQELLKFITFQQIPYATLIMGIIAIVSLLITYSMYDRIMLLGTTSHEVTEKSQDPQEKQLYHVIEEMKVAAGLRYMPKVFIIEAEYMNAFASGFSEKSAMVAITRGLLMKLTRSELQAVMAHELSHIRHLDIKLTLTVAVLSNIMLIVIDMLFYSVLFSRDRRGDNRLATVILILRFVLPLLTVLLTLFLSRTREYMADAGCVELMRDNQPMASALMKIDDDHHANADYYAEEYGATAHEDVRRAAYIYDPSRAGLHGLKGGTSMFSTHPGIRDRLKAIGITFKE